MLARRSEGRVAKVVFAADFRQSVYGELGPDGCLLVYDPFRLVPPSEFNSPSDIIFNATFHPSGERWTGKMTGAAGMMRTQLADDCGQGRMWTIKLTSPSMSEGIECNFQYASKIGIILLDNNDGANYLIRFPTKDVKEIDAIIVNDTALNSIDGAEERVDRLLLRLTTVAEVDSIIMRWSQLKPVSERKAEELIFSDAQGEKIWVTREGGIEVSSSADVVFDLVYKIGGRFFTDDNEGNFYTPSRQSVQTVRG
jgi:hypothetical protein